MKSSFSKSKIAASNFTKIDSFIGVFLDNCFLGWWFCSVNFEYI